MNPIIFKIDELPFAWEYFYHLCAEEQYDYLSLMEMVLIKQIWICFKKPNKFLEKRVLKLHGVL